MDELEELLIDMWSNYKPYNRAANDTWRSYIIGNSEAVLLETDENCITICNGTNGIYMQ